MPASGSCGSGTKLSGRRKLPREFEKHGGGTSDDRTDLGSGGWLVEWYCKKDTSARYRYLLVSKNRRFGYPVSWVARSQKAFERSERVCRAGAAEGFMHVLT